MFSEEAARTIQFVTIPFELIGIALAAIEIRLPHLSASVSNHILKEGQHFLGPVSRRQTLEFGVGICLGVGIAAIIDQTNSPEVLGVSVFALIAVCASYCIAAYWVPSRAIGTFGLSIASFGLTGEIYQFLVAYT